MQISEIPEEKLKAMAYDIVTAIQKSQNDLHVINQELIRRQNEKVKQGREGTDKKKPGKEHSGIGDIKAKPAV